MTNNMEKAKFTSLAYCQPYECLSSRDVAQDMRI